MLSHTTLLLVLLSALLPSTLASPANPEFSATAVTTTFTAPPNLATTSSAGNILSNILNQASSAAAFSATGTSNTSKVDITAVLSSLPTESISNLVNTGTWTGLGSPTITPVATTRPTSGAAGVARADVVGVVGAVVGIAMMV